MPDGRWRDVLLFERRSRVVGGEGRAGDGERFKGTREGSPAL